MATKQTDIVYGGLTRGEYQALAKSKGYTGEFGSGQHAAWLDADPNRRRDLDTAITTKISNINKNYGSIQNYQMATKGIDLLGMATAGYSLTKFGTTTALSSAIDSAAANALPGVFNPGTYGPQLAGSGSLSLSGALTGAGVGFTIGSLTTLVTGGNPIGAGIGGAVGGGLAAAGALAPIGLAAGPVGIIVASIAGGLIGGLFEGKEKNTSSAGVLFFNADGTIKDARYGAAQTSTETGKAITGNFASFVASLNKNVKADLSNVQAYGGYDKKYGGAGGYYIRNDAHSGQAGDIKENFDPKKNETITSAFANTYERLIRQNDVTNKAIIGKLDAMKAKGMTSEQAITALYTEGAQATAATPPTTTPTTPKGRIEQQVSTSQKQYDDFIAKVEEGKAGRADTIKTGPRGLLEEPEEIFRPQLRAA